MPKPDLVLLHAPSNYDFRERAIMYGPISDVIPPTPIFEMYPIGFISLAGYLERRGINVRIVNIANQMLRRPKFDVEHFLKGLSPLAFGLDLHWLPHAHGSLELARLIKQLHPTTPVIFGGLSATYFYQELIEYPQVDFVIRGDSTELPLLLLMQQLKNGSRFDEIPNLSWKDKNGAIHHNPLSWVPSSLGDFPLDYTYPTKSVLKYRDLGSLLPFQNWLSYPITMALTCRGCTHDCLTCGGSNYAYKKFYNRDKPAYRPPKLVVQDVQSIQRYLSGPVFIVGDIRQPGEDYAEELLQAMRNERIRGPIVLELFKPAEASFFRRVKEAVPNFNIQISPESWDEEVRRSFGKGYKNQDLEKTIEAALENGCQRFDLFFMIGLPKQDYSSVMETASYCRNLLKEFNHRNKLHPHISPLAPFLDPGSRVFEAPEKYGYRLLYHTLEEHRQALLSPSWKYMLNYETQWLSRDEIVNSTYEVALAFNQLKLEHGLITAKMASSIEFRAKQAMKLMEEIDRLIKQGNLEFKGEKAKLEGLTASTICQKKELEWPAISFLRNAPRILWAFCSKSK